jgi:hypothetical protein
MMFYQSWRLVLLPLWLAWPVTAAASWWLKAPSERVGGSLSDLTGLAALLAADNFFQRKCQGVKMD